MPHPAPGRPPHANPDRCAAVGPRRLARSAPNGYMLVAVVLLAAVTLLHMMV